jgi:hypothetical protein
MGLSIYPVPSTGVATVNRRGIGNVSVSMPAGYYRVEGADTLPTRSNGILQTTSTLSTIAITDFIEETITTPLFENHRINPQGMIYFNNLWIIAAISVVTNQVNVYTSPDLITWTVRNSNMPNVSIRGFKVVNNIAFLISGQTLGAVSTSTDGISWTLRNTGAGTTNLFTAAFGNGQYIVGGATGQLFSSPNLTTWTQRGSQFGTNNTIRDAAFGNGRFVIIGGGSTTAGNNVSYSTDGINWTNSSNSNAYNYDSATYTNFTSVVFANGRFVAPHSGANNANQSFISVSTDGDLWTPVNFGFAGTNNNITSITHLNGVYIAVGVGWTGISTAPTYEQFVTFSLDGRNWVIKPIKFLKYLFAVNQFFTATDGVNILLSNSSSGAPIMVLRPANIAITPIGA